MSFTRPPKLQAVADALLNRPGHTQPTLRKQVWAFMTALINLHARGPGLNEAKAGDDAVPANLRPYLHKLAKHAYRISDEDIDALRRDGYSEDMIFELTASAALAAGLAQMDRGLALLAAAGNAQGDT